MKHAGAKCHFCDICDGHGCVGELPGMGGAYDNANFIDNCAAWAAFHASSAGRPLPAMRLAPITGATQNVGWEDEESFYGELVAASIAGGLRLSIGDGYPDEKLKFGIAALRAASAKGAVFVKPYDNARILERMEWARPVAEILGVDIDSWGILTMRNLVNLEEKTGANLLELKRASKAPFAIKGIFRERELELVRDVRPDIVVVSNHGGRVETERGSTAAFLARYGAELRKYSGEVWVDGGIRSAADARAAGALGADEVLVARPIITALLAGGREAVVERARALTDRAAVPESADR